MIIYGLYRLPCREWSVWCCGNGAHSQTDGNEYGEIKEVGDGYIIVRALNNRDYIGQEITLEASNDEYGVSASIILTIGRWY